MRGFLWSGKRFLKSVLLVCTVLTLQFFHLSESACSDWPMWRYDSGRTASSPDNLPDELYLQWVRQYSQREMVWDDPLNQDLMPYDRIFEPVVSGNTLFIEFNDSDKIVAIDAMSGSEKWSFRTDGPVRFSPVVSDGKVYFTSDDGCLYCVNAENGEQAWKIRGGPSDRKILGNKRFISTWPARGAPVIDEGVVYFAAGIWPFMGIFIYAVDADSGDIVWTNESNGSRYMQQPHNAYSFAGVAPQGAIVVEGDKLLVPGGRSVPACFDKHTGEYLYYELAESGKTGGSYVCASSDVFFNHYRDQITSMYDIQSGITLFSQIGRYPVIESLTFYFSGKTVRAFDSGWIGADLQQWRDDEVPRGDVLSLATAKMEGSLVWEIEADATGDMIKAGNRVYAAGTGKITAIDISGAESGPEIAWTKTVDGNVERLVAANDMLFAVTLDGRIMAFGKDRKTPTLILERPYPSEPSIKASQKARDILDMTDIREGYALFYGVGDGDLLEALVTNSELHIVAVDPDELKVRAVRERFDANGLYGKRISVLQGDPYTLNAPQYMASLSIIHDLDMSKYPPDEILLNNMHSSLRPYGGTALLPYTGRNQDSIVRSMYAIDSMKTAVIKGDDFTLLKREGPLEGAGEWTHNYGNIANTVKSDDSIVKLPLGLLWFGGNSNEDVLPRHGHGPTEQIVGGRMIIEGMDSISARDVYTGRVLWKVTLDDLGTFDIYYDRTYKDMPTSTEYNQVHIPGANVRGTNYIATADRVYLVMGSSCIVLDSATGARLATFTLPRIDPENNRSPIPPWGYIGIYENLLIAGYGNVAFTDLLQANKAEYTAWQSFDTSASKGLVVMDRISGEVKWNIDSRHGFIHNSIAAGNGKLYCLDTLPPLVESQLKRRGMDTPEISRLLAMNIQTGEIAWEKEEDIFGSFISYSVENDVLIQSTRPSRDTVGGESGKRIISYNAVDGSVVWDKNIDYQTFPILHGDRIITESGMFDLVSGEPMFRSDPLTDTNSVWSWKRFYGCNYPVASENLLTFRSGAAGFFDLLNDGGTGNFGGFKSGCTANLIAADGVLNAPDYTRTCSCSYQNQTSLALVHMPDLEYWTFNTLDSPAKSIKRVGVNFGAPGDRLDDNGTLWLDYPSVGGESPELVIVTIPENPDWYRRHSSRIEGGDLPWVAASGGTGVRDISITLDTESKGAEYTVRLFFAEPENVKAGERVFDVSLQGKQVLKKFDVVKEAKKPLQTLVREFKNVKVDKDLKVTLEPYESSINHDPVISGIEIVIED